MQMIAIFFFPSLYHWSWRFVGLEQTREEELVWEKIQDRMMLPDSTKQTGKRDIGCVEGEGGVLTPAGCEMFASPHPHVTFFSPSLPPPSLSTQMRRCWMVTVLTVPLAGRPRPPAYLRVLSQRAGIAPRAQTKLSQIYCQ